MDDEERLKKESQKSANPDAAYELVNLISEISEEYHSAGWLSGIEYALWDEVQGKVFANPITNEEKTKLQELSQLCQGWWYFDEEEEEKFVPMSDWIKMVEDISIIYQGIENKTTGN